MNLTRFLYFIATIVEVAKSSADADDVSLLAQRLFKSTHLLRGSGLNDEKESEEKGEKTSVNRSPKRMLEAGNKRLLQLKSINIGCCDDDDDDSESNEDDESSTSTSMYPSPTPSITRYEVKKLVASDGSVEDWFGSSCSMSGDLVVIGAPFSTQGAAYLFHLDGTEIKKLTPGDDGEEDYDVFGWSVAMDEKIVVGSFAGYVRVFSRDGTYERTLTCDDCASFGKFGWNVATLGNLIVMDGYQNFHSIVKLFIYSTEDGQMLKSLDQGSDNIRDVAMSEQFIVSTTWGDTFVYSNTSPDFPKVAEINQGGKKVAVAGDRIVIANDYNGVAYLYKTDGTLVTALDRQDASSGSGFGWSVAITDDKVLVGARYDDDQGYRSGSVFIYSAVTGEFVEKVLAPDGGTRDLFGSCVSASDSYFVVGASGGDTYTGAAYLFQSSE